MPKRQTTTKAQSHSVQGKGSWVKWKAPTVTAFRDFRVKLSELNERTEQILSQLTNGQSELKTLRDEDDLDETAIDETENQISTLKDELKVLNKEIESVNTEFMCQYIVEWNWVADEEGKIEMEQPLNNPDVFYELTTQETKFLAQLFMPVEGKKKRR